MKTWGKWIIGALVVALVSVLGLGINSVSAQEDDLVRPRGWAADIVIGAVAEATGLSADEIREQVQDGNSLRDILEAGEVDVEAVIEDITAQLTAEIEQALEDDVLNQRQADRMLDRLPDMIEHALDFCTCDHPFMGRMMDDEWDGFFGMRGEHRGMMGQMAGHMMGHHGSRR